MNGLNKLRRKFEGFCFRNRNKGIPNLMLYIALTSGLVYLLSLLNGGDIVQSMLCFDKAAILRGQVWRLFTFVFTNSLGSSVFLVPIYLYFFYHLGRAVELSMGTFRFNLFYFSGVILMDLFAMIFCPLQDVIVGNYLVPVQYFTGAVYSDMAFYLHLSLLLYFATANPDAQFLVFFVIPVKAWFMGILYLLLVFIGVFNMSFPCFLFPHNLFPLIGLANYLLFAGRDVKNLFPFLTTFRRRRKYRSGKTGTIPFRRETGETSAYQHKCAVCGRTDVSDPDLEFRYCSRCRGYHCYCQDHINNHSHIE